MVHAFPHSQRTLNQYLMGYVQETCWSGRRWPRPPLLTPPQSTSQEQIRVCRPGLLSTPRAQHSRPPCFASTLLQVRALQHLFILFSPNSYQTIDMRALLFRLPDLFQPPVKQIIDMRGLCYIQRCRKGGTGLPSAKQVFPCSRHFFLIWCKNTDLNFLPALNDMNTLLLCFH